MKVGDIGEELFKEFCNFHSWDEKQISRSAVPTPDFLVTTPSGKFIAEISVVNYEMELGKAYSIDVGKKVRDKIKEKKKQLQNQKYPTLLALCGSSVHLGYESIVAAMYGDLTIKIGVISGKTSAPYYGKNAKMQEGRNTSISAIAFLTRTLKNHDEGLKDNPETLPCIAIYHNMFAANPFPKDFFPKGERLIDEYFFEKVNVPKNA